MIVYSYELLPATTYVHAENMRIIRNSCKEYMTNNNSHISSNEQEAWFESLNREKIMPFLFIANHISLGYGIIKLEDSKAILTGGILNGYRGKGFGRLLFQKLIHKSIELGKIPSLDVLKTNTTAINLYKSLGFMIIEEFDDIYRMEIQ